MRLRRRWLVLPALFVVLLAAAPDRAAALSCSLSVTPLTLAAHDVTLGVAEDTSGTITANCSGGVLLTTIRICVAFGLGSAGAISSGERYLSDGVRTMKYGLYADAARTTPWGSFLWPAGGGADAGVIDVALNLSGSGSASRPIYMRVPGGQQTLPASTYTSTLSGVDAVAYYGLLSGFLGCALLTTNTTTSATVSVTVPPMCRVTADALNFGTVASLAGAITAATAIRPTCTNGTAFQIGLDGGLSAATNPAGRKMTNGAETITYGLYRDGGHVLPAGNTLGGDTFGLIGTGMSQSVPVYGRVPPQPTPAPGTYGDTVTVTVTY